MKNKGRKNEQGWTEMVRIKGKVKRKKADMNTQAGGTAA
jgi:hypothetical protein